MTVIYYLRPFPSEFIETLFDSTFLLVMLSPILYIFLFRPLLLHIGERKQAEEALQKIKAEEYKAILDTTMDGFWFVDAKGRILDVNDAYCALTGYSREKLLKMMISDVEAAEEPEDTAGHLRKVIETGHDRFETRHRCKDGRIIDVEVSVNYKKAAERFYVFIRDISASKKYEEEIHAAKEELKEKVIERTSELSKTNDQLALRVMEIERQNMEAGMLNKMGELLHTCDTLEEAYSVVTHSASQLFPNDSGVLFIINASRNLLESVLVFGNPPQMDHVFPPHECWALRRGRLYNAEDVSTGLLCRHLRDSGNGHICLPLMAHGEALGVLHLLSGPSDNTQDSTGLPAAKRRMRLLLSVAEHISMTVANLRLREILRNLSIRDHLTGLFNRRYMEESLEREHLRAKRSNTSLGIIMFDIDHFKQFNDVFGHDAGDALLRELGIFLRQNIRGSDIICRYGGEEFIIIMPETTLEIVRQRAEYLKEETKHLQVQYNHQPLSAVTLSLGVAVFPEHGLTTQAVVQAADAALYRAKETGRDRVCVAHE